MVLERLVSPKQLAGHPWELLLVGALYANVALGAAYVLVPGFASLTMVAFAVILTMPFVYNSLLCEEQLYVRFASERALFTRHLGLFKKFLYLFLGFTLTFMLWYTLVPDHVASTLFDAQVNTIRSINNVVSGQFNSMSTFWLVFSHNLQVFVVCLLLSFFFGSGAIYLLTWNASVLGAGMGTKLRSALEASSRLGLQPPLHFLAYLIHGVPEVLAYIVGGVIGGTLSYAYIRRELHGATWSRMSKDLSVLIGIGIALLVVAGLLEVYVSPHFL